MMAVPAGGGSGGRDDGSRRSRPAEDLSREPLLRHTKKVTLDGAERPSAAGRIALLSKLGRGGMGVVYHGVHLRLGTEVAVKLLPLSMHGQTEDLVRRFEREAQIAARLRSPHLVSVSDIDEDPETGCHFIVMEYVHGMSADRVARENPAGMTEADALDVCIAATKGLVVAHMEGVVHRDIKPSNILVPAGPDGTLRPALSKLADLGLARQEEAGRGMTLDASLLPMGTPGYMAPEQTLGASRAKKPADVFAMGATLFALLVGRAPFSGEDVHECLAATREGRRPSLRTLRPDVSEVTQILVDRCLHVDPEKRFSDAPALLEALEICRAALAGAAGNEVTTRVVALTLQPEQGKRVATGTPVLPESETIPGPRGAATLQPTHIAPPTQIASGTQAAPPTVPAAVPPTMVASAARGDTQPAAPAAGPPQGDGRPWRTIAAVAVALALIGAIVLLFIGKDPATLTITSRPAGADVKLAGHSVGRTPISRMEVAPGALAVEVSLAGHETERLDLSVVEGQQLAVQEVVLRPVQPPVAPKPVAPRSGEETPPVKRDIESPKPAPPKAPETTAATLAVSTKPAAALLLIDGAEAGTTPVAGIPVTEGTHDVELRLDGHETHRVRITITAGEQRDLGEIALRAMASLTMELGAPDVTVQLNGKVVILPLKRPLHVVPGKYFVEFLRTGYVTQSVDITVGPGEERRLSAAPWRLIPGRILLGALPKDAVASIGGAAVTDGQEFAPGDYVVKLERPGHRAQDVRVTVKSDADSEVRAQPWEAAVAALRYAWRQGLACRFDWRSKIVVAAADGFDDTTGGASTTRIGSLQVASVGSDGSAVLTLRFERVREETTNDNGVSVEDSADGAVANGDGALAGRSFDVTVAADGSVTRVAGGGFRWSATAEGAFTAADTERAIASIVRGMLPRYPADGRQAGTWKTRHEEIEAFFVSAADITWQKGSTEDGLLGLTFDRTAKLVNGTVSGLPQMRVTQDRSTGQFTADPATGVPLRLEVRRVASLVNPEDDEERIEARDTTVISFDWRGGSAGASGGAAADPAPRSDPPPVRETPKTAPSQTQPGAEELRGAYNGRVTRVQSSGSEFSAELPSDWTLAAREASRIAASPGANPDRDGLVSIGLTSYTAELKAMTSVQRLDVVLAGTREAFASMSPRLATPERFAVGGRSGVGQGFVCDVNGTQVAVWIGVVDVATYSVAVLAVVPGRLDSPVIAAGKRALASAEVTTVPAPPSASQALAGQSFGASEFFGASGSISTVYTFRADGSVSRRSMSSFSTGGGSDSTTHGTWRADGDVVRITIEGEVTTGRIEGDGSNVRGLRIGTKLYAPM